MIGTVRGIVLAPVLEALWNLYGRGRTRFAFTLQDLIPKNTTGTMLNNDLFEQLQPHDQSALHSSDN